MFYNSTFCVRRSVLASTIYCKKEVINLINLVHQITQAPQLRYAPFGDRFHSARKKERKRKGEVELRSTSPFLPNAKRKTGPRTERSVVEGHT
jgi:hypothetical protein